MRQFPILLTHREWPYGTINACRAFDVGSIPIAVPWDLVAVHEAQALTNHDQTVKQLADRCGLSWCELVAVLEDRPWRRMDDIDAIKRVNELVFAHAVAQRAS